MNIRLLLLPLSVSFSKALSTDPIVILKPCGPRCAGCVKPISRSQRRPCEPLTASPAARHSISRAIKTAGSKPQQCVHENDRPRVGDSENSRNVPAGYVAKHT